MATKEIILTPEGREELIRELAEREGVKNDEIVYVPITKAVKIDKPISQELLDVLDTLSI
jgi:hypothetical protein